jgi:hypothetical protein
MENNTQEFFSRKQLAAMFGVTTHAILNWEKAGKLAAVRLGPTVVRYSRESVAALIAASSAGAR